MYTSYTGPSSLYPLPFPLPLAFHHPFSSPFPLSLLFVLSPCLLCPVSSPVSIGLPFFSENYTCGRNIYRCIGSFMYRSVPHPYVLRCILLYSMSLLAVSSPFYVLVTCILIFCKSFLDVSSPSLCPELVCVLSKVYTI